MGARVRPPKRPVRLLAITTGAGVLLLVLLAFVVCSQPRPAPKPSRPSPVATVSASPSAKPTRSPTIITTPPPTATPFIGTGQGKG